MSHRVINGLRWAGLSEKGPGFQPKRLRGRKAAGIRYEKALAAALPVALHGQWIEFIDKNGKGFAQPDFLLEFEQYTVILETKYTWVAEGHSQIEYLYKPLVELLWGRPAFGIVVAKVLTPDVRQMPCFATLDEAIAAAIRAERTVVWHYIGSGPLFGASASKTLGEAAKPLYP